MWGMKIDNWNSYNERRISKSHLNKVLILLYRMKKKCVEPDRKVYSAVVYTLAKSRLVSGGNEFD